MDKKKTEARPVHDHKAPALPVVFVSACLMGVNCRYNGNGERLPEIIELMDRALLVPVCPEVLGGLPTPREPAERIGNEVITRSGIRVTKQYQKGAREVEQLATLYHCAAALLKERSPSCGNGVIYDGTHSRSKIKGDGVTVEHLKRHGIPVFGESNIEELKDFIDTIRNL